MYPLYYIPVLPIANTIQSTGKAIESFFKFQFFVPCDKLCVWWVYQPSCMAFKNAIDVVVLGIANRETQFNNPQ
jgi:hypothetical protein